MWGVVVFSLLTVSDSVTTVNLDTEKKVIRRQHKPTIAAPDPGTGGGMNMPGVSILKEDRKGQQVKPKTLTRRVKKQEPVEITPDGAIVSDVSSEGARSPGHSSSATLDADGQVVMSLEQASTKADGHAFISDTDPTQQMSAPPSAPLSAKETAPSSAKGVSVSKGQSDARGPVADALHNAKAELDNQITEQEKEAKETELEEAQDDGALADDDDGALDDDDDGALVEEAFFKGGKGGSKSHGRRRNDGWRRRIR